MSSTPSVPHAAPVPSNWWHASGGIWRLTARRFFAPGQWLFSTIGLVVLGLLTAAVVGGHGPSQFTSWVNSFYLTFLIPVLAFLSAAGAIREDTKSSTVDYVFTRPVRRPFFVIVKFLAHVGCAQAIYLVPLGLILAIGVSLRIDGVLVDLPWFLLAQAVSITVFMALGFLCGAVTSRYLVLGIAYASVVEAGIGHIPTQLNRVSMTTHVRTILAQTSDATAAFGTDASVLGAVGTLLMFSAIMVASAAFLFGQRELAGARAADL